MSMNLDQTADKITPSSGTLNIAGGATLTTALPIALEGQDCLLRVHRATFWYQTGQVLFYKVCLAEHFN